MAQGNSGGLNFTVDGVAVYVDEAVLDPDTTSSVLIVVQTGKQLYYIYLCVKKGTFSIVM